MIWGSRKEGEGATRVKDLVCRREEGREGQTGWSWAGCVHNGGGGQESRFCRRRGPYSRKGETLITHPMSYGLAKHHGSGTLGLLAASGSWARNELVLAQTPGSAGREARREKGWRQGQGGGGQREAGWLPTSPPPCSFLSSLGDLRGSRKAGFPRLNSSVVQQDPL